MRLILVGCEYAGKTTLANEIVKWIDDTLGGARGFHDHFTIPSNELTVEDQDQFAALSPRLKEMFQRYIIEYHLQPAFYADPDHNMTGFHIEEAGLCAVVLRLRWQRRICGAHNVSAGG